MFVQFLKEYEELSICENVEQTISALKKLYNVQIEHLKTISQKNMSAYALESATYPLLSVNLNGEYYASPLTRPDLFEHYYKEECRNIDSIQIQIPSESRFAVSKSKQSIPLALVDEDLAAALTQEQMAFRKINILAIEAVEEVNGQQVRPLQWFHPTRTDYSINRLKHYTGVDAQYLQNHILFVNYQKYLPYFIEFAKEEIAKGNYIDLIGPGDTSLVKNKMQMPSEWNNSITLPQMPAYNLIKQDRNGISLINIGVSASNAKTMADHLAVLRPKFALMVGHCGSFMKDHAIGDYIVGYDHLMIDFNHTHRDSISLSHVGRELSRYVLTDRKTHFGPILSVSDRNWELQASKVHQSVKDFGIIGVDMESAMIVKTFEQYGIHAGSFLCVSDRPFHREIRLQKMAKGFYDTKLKDHLKDSINIMQEFAMKHQFERIHEDGPLFR